MKHAAVVGADRGPADRLRAAVAATGPSNERDRRGRHPRRRRHARSAAEIQYGQRRCNAMWRRRAHDDLAADLAARTELSTGYRDH